MFPAYAYHRQYGNGKKRYYGSMCLLGTGTVGRGEQSKHNGPPRFERKGGTRYLPPNHTSCIVAMSSK